MSRKRKLEWDADMEAEEERKRKELKKEAEDEALAWVQVKRVQANCAEWARLRADTPLTLSDADLDRLKSVNDPISLSEVVEIYLPLSRLLSLYAEATQRLHSATRNFLGTRNGGVPFIIGIAGSVAVGAEVPEMMN